MCSLRSGIRAITAQRFKLSVGWRNPSRFLVGYTWSKAIDDLNTPIDVYNRVLSRALSGFDTPHQFIGSWVYQMPFGKGRKMDLGGAGNALLGDWNLSGIVRVQSGQPVTINTPA